LAEIERIDEWGIGGHDAASCPPIPPRTNEVGCEVKGLGRGHVKRIKDQVKAEK